MAFESLSEKLNSVFKKLRGKGRLKEGDIKEAMREVRLALLEADVGFKVVKEFIAKVSERCLGADILDSLSPSQMVIKIVNEELCALMGEKESKITVASNPPTIIMLIGLQGSGKTTNGAKLAAYLRKNNGKSPMLVACDIYRPAAILQLQTVGKQLDIPVFEMGTSKPVDIAKSAITRAKKEGIDTVILDTAGRLHIDTDLIDELKDIKREVSPTEILLVIDSMTGQDAVNAAESFNNEIGIDGVILTKLDGDARGGAALSVRAVTGKPIKFAGVGEKLDQIETFHPDRMASRILGMGDVLTLIEKAEQAFDEKKAQEMTERLMQNRFTLSDYFEQLSSLKSMGGLSEIAGMIPGLDSKALEGAQVDEGVISKTEAIILSMTQKERDDPSILNSSRKRRIAAGSGTAVVDINRLLKQFEAMKMMTKQLKKGKMPGIFGGAGRKAMRITTQI